MKKVQNIENERAAGNKPSREAGFSLIEVSVAMVVILIALLGVFFTFTYAITYNAGNNSRAQALAIMQEEVEVLRSRKWTPTFRDSDLDGGVHTLPIVTSPNGGTFSVVVTIDNDPTVAGVQTESHVCQSPQAATVECTIKEIEVRVTLENPSPGWQAAVPATIVMRRVRAN